jgi:hypothetical protein
VKIRKSHAQLGIPEGAGIKSLDNERFRVTLRLTISRSVLVSSPVCGSGPDFSLRFDLMSLSLWGVLSPRVKNLSLSVVHVHNTYDFMYVYYTWPVRCELS